MPPFELITPLRELYYRGGNDQEFALDFAGSYAPPERPHLSDWDVADEHWIKAVSDFLRSTEAIPFSRETNMVKVVEGYVRALLWALALDGKCNNCRAEP